MGYRNKEPKKKPEDFLPRFGIRNGATLRTAFACYYFTPADGHDPKYHDHIGWPAPDHPDESCQMKPARYPINGLPRPVLRTKDDLTPINLTDEGYAKASITFDDPAIAEFITASAYIDETDDHLVNVSIAVDAPTFKDKPIDVRFTVFVSDESESVRDAVCHGILSILPGSSFKEGQQNG